MSTQAQPLTGKAAELLAAINSGIDGRLRRFATLEQLEGVKTFVADKMRENLDAIIATKQGPSIGRGSWRVRNPRTGEVHNMEYSLSRLFWVLSQRKNGIMPKDKACAREVEYLERTITEGTAGAGGTLIPQEWADFVIPELGAKVAFLKGGPNVLPMQHQVMNIPGLTNNASYSWLGENAAISESAPATNNTPLTLHTLKGLTGFSIEWLRDATPETDAAVQANLVRGAMRAVDLGYFYGSGGSTQPTGIANVSGIGTSVCGGGANGATPTTDDVSTCILGLDEANVSEAQRVWFCNPRTIDRFRRLKNTLGDPILWTNPANALEMRLNGYPIFTTTQIPINQSQGTANTASTLFLVAMDDMFVGQGIKSLGLEVAISEEALFSSAEIAVRLLYRTDIQPGHAASIYALTGVL
ncbi:MAG TPA: phage major capsid protein [Candidatus Acidoferrales bacterium]|jgi:HK97 family phage major capsid protein|nr:phage major capsid protein [Candidatus Acidoferrales bacterium]